MGTNNSEESIILVVLSLALNKTGVPPFCLLVGTIFRSQWYFSTLFHYFSTGSQGHKVQYIKRIMTWLEGRKRPMIRAAKLARTRIDESLGKRPEEMALCVHSSVLQRFRAASLTFKSQRRKSQRWTVVSEKSQEMEVLLTGVASLKDEMWNLLAGLASWASDLYNHTGPEKGVSCSVSTS